MGCCISIPENHSLENQLHTVQDKLVISQAPPTSNILYPSKKLKHISPSSPTSSTSSICSFTCTTNSNSTTSSSSLTFKDRSFSNEFLWSCYKENPHIIRINSLKEATHSFVPTKPKVTSSPMSNLAPIRQSPPQKKRVRSNSPVNLTRQKSFRKEVADQRLGSSYNLASGMLRSPSPSRRFNGDNTLSKKMSGPKTNVSYSHSSSSLRKENIKPISPNNSSRRLTHSGLRHRESCNYKVNDSKIDETNMVKEVVSNNGVDSGLIEDIENPLVSFDCFIFL
ncbi:unnamed protein product [Lupinus luteus]|uniref:Uncharacterized protein n=1 Tax=Lupinus luteus TaxID=3873 RepID=A0AAV1XA08_LUPLU